jgi:carboxyl-terminal processing protease
MIRSFLLGLLFMFSCALTIQAQEAVDKMSGFLKTLEKYYIQEIDQDSLVEQAIKSMLKELDPHSNYLSKKALQKSNEELGGNFEGVGIQFNILEDTIFVVQTISGGPSESVGIMAGDKIVEVDGEIVAGIGIDNDGVIKRLRGEKGTKVEVKIVRKDVKELLDFVITRDKIPIFALDASYMINEDIGYIRLSRFSATATDEVRAAISDLKEQGMKDLVLDLTGNGGGYLAQAVALADEFLSEDKLLVYTEGRAFPKKEENAKREGAFEEGNLVIMIDQSSASASEIVSGAVQDWDRGLLVGRRSFGKGLVQRTFYLPDRSAIRLTVANYYTPSGRFIQRSYDNGREDYYKDLQNRFESGELLDESKVEFPDSLKHYTTGNRVVYGGGGIMPDIFVSIDTSFSSDFLGKLSRRGILNRFTLDYVDEYRDELEAEYSNVKDFKNNFEVDDMLLEDLYAYAAENEVEPGDEDFSNSIPRIRNWITALIARNLWRSSAYYEVVNDLNPIYNEAVEVIRNKKLYKKLKIAYNN